MAKRLNSFSLTNDAEYCILLTPPSPPGPQLLITMPIANCDLCAGQWHLIVATTNSFRGKYCSRWAFITNHSARDEAPRARADSP